MNNKKWLIGMMVFALLIANAPTADAFWGKKGGDRRPDKNKMIERIADKLELTEAQKAKFKASGEKTQEFVKIKHEAVKSLAEKLKTELGKDKPSRWVVNRLIKQMSSLKTDIQIKHANHLIDLKQELTPEQRKKFEEMLKDRHKKFGKRKPRKI
ncbi:MAG: Spy/CpxP family protein refolding chaperone [Candidatus Margulisiibacteriota bacterium]|nr:Spy/CpxP family protein refolding chaperone [Candidatus Margulisiibacteriota bacterium]